MRDLYLESEKLLSKNITHGFFSKIKKISLVKNDDNSVSGKCFLNCSKYVGDDPLNVKQNLEIVKTALRASRIITLKQVHSNACIFIDPTSEPDAEVDAMVTNAKGIAIGVLTADCAPILLADSSAGIIGAAHAGWKGAVSGVIKTTVEKMMQIGATLQNINAAIGPCISVDSYEVSDNFKNNFPDHEDCFSVINSKLHFNLQKFCFKALIAAGLSEKSIDLLNVDTYSNNRKYFSYRYENHHVNEISGRNISAICLI